MGGKRSREEIANLEEVEADMPQEELEAVDVDEEPKEELAGFSGRVTGSEEEDEQDVEDEQGAGLRKRDSGSERNEAGNSGLDVGDEEHNGDQLETMQKKKSKPRNPELNREKLQRLQETYRQRGVIYLSRIPPFMKPLKLRHILSQYGEVLRVYLAPEDPRLRKKRKQAGGNSGKNFTEGWVEFADKGVAKRVASALNGQNIGGKRRSAYFYDLWNIKYLPKFKWDHLTEEIAYRNAVREQKLQAELSQAKKERDFYLAKVDQAHAIEAMEQRHSKQEGANGAHNEKAAARRTFVQRKPVSDPDASRVVSDNVLAGVFGMGNAAKRKRQKEASS